MWLKDFFNRNYTGPAGDGFYGMRHLIWIIGTILFAIVLYQYFKRHPKYARRIMIIFCSLLFGYRLINQICRAVLGIENPPLQAVPWHLCTLMTFVMPIVLIFELKKLKPMVYSLCMIGGIVTLFMESYFDNAFLTWWEIEGMWAHMLLIFVPVIEMAIGNFKLEFKNAWQTVVGLIGCTLWALFADVVLFADYDSNNSELMENMLGFDIPGIPYPVVVVFIAIIFITVMYAIPTIYRKIRR